MRNGERGNPARVVVVIDEVGTVLGTLAAANLGVPLLHVRHRRDLGELTDVSLVVIAAYGIPRWSEAAAAAGSAPTVGVASPRRPADAGEAPAALACGYHTAPLAPN